MSESVIIVHKLTTIELGKNKIFGGAEKISWQLFTNLAKKGINVNLIAHNEKRETWSEESKTFIGIPKFRYSDEISNFLVKKAQSTQKLPILHLGANNMPYFYPQLWYYPTVCHFHEQANLLHMGNGNNISYRIFCSRFNKNTWSGYGTELKEEDYSIVHSFVDLDEIGEPNYSKEPIILYVGAIALEKGTFEYLRIANKMPNIKFYLIGSGCLWGRDDQNIQNRCPPNVQWLGLLPQKQVFEWMKKASVVVVPSHCNDNCPIVVLEAQACGTPVVASKDGGIPEILVDGETGFLVDLPDLSVENFPIEDFKKKIEYLLNENEMGKKGRKFVEEKFTWEKGIEKYLDIYKKMRQKQNEKS